MKKLVLAAILISACSTLTFAQAEKPAAKAPSASAAVKQLEKDWTEATKANDTDKLGQILADDWTGIGPDGDKMTKQAYLDMYKSGKAKTESVDLGAMDVKVIGSVAIVQGTDKKRAPTMAKTPAASTPGPTSSRSATANGSPSAAKPPKPSSH